MTPQEYLTASKNFNGSDSFTILLQDGLNLLKYSYTDLAYDINYSAQTVLDWVNGGTPPVCSIRKIIISILRSKTLDLQASSPITETVPIPSPIDASLTKETKDTIWSVKCDLQIIDDVLKIALRVIAADIYTIIDAIGKDLSIELLSNIGFACATKDDCLGKLQTLETKIS